MQKAWAPIQAPRLSETERSAVLGDTASHVYGIEAPAG